jgi:hypothetical protein
MIINRHRLTFILVAGVLVGLAGNVLASRIAVSLLCPEPTVSLECFDRLRRGMTEKEALVCCGFSIFIDAPPPRHQPPRHQQLQFGNDEDLEIVLVIDDGILSDGRATVSGRLVRPHLDAADPLLDPIRLGLHDVHAKLGPDNPLEPPCYVGGLIGAISLVAALSFSLRQSPVRKGPAA